MITSLARIRFNALFVMAIGILTSVLASGCNDDPTTVVVDNGYSTTVPATVYRAWWVTTLFPHPVAAGESSETERTIPGNDLAYALLAPGWSPDDTTPPPRLIALRSKNQLAATTHELLHIAVSDDTFTGNCDTGSTLDAEDAQLVVGRIFPGAFAGLTYDPATCTSAPVAGDAGVSNDAATAGDGSAD